MAFSRAIYSDHDRDELFLGMYDLQFKELVYSRRLVWAPDGDEAFDDSSNVLQFDVDDKVRLIAFSRRADSLFDPASLRDVWLAQDDFYDTLLRWRDGFHAEWESLSKADTDPYLQ